MRLAELDAQSTHDNTSDGADKDGDMSVTRKKKAFNLALTISHKTASPLSQVGLQVWSGCLIMCDYLLSHPHSVRGHVVLELGSGTGMAAILVAHITSVVFATDNSAPVLSRCKINVENNIDACGEVHVGFLDWKNGFVPTLEDNSLKEFVYSPQQREVLRSSDVIIGCDTVYDLEGVNLFLSCVEWLVCEYLRGKLIELYLSLERRVNFSLDTLSAGCQPYDVLFQGLARLRDKLNEVNIRVSWEQIYLVDRQMLEYERSDHLQLWKIAYEKFI